MCKEYKCKKHISKGEIDLEDLENTVVTKMDGLNSELSITQLLRECWDHLICTLYLIMQAKY